MKIVVI